MSRMPSIEIKHMTSNGKVTTRFSRIEEIGKGVYSIVYKGYNKKTEEWCAIKTITKFVDGKHLFREIRIHEILDHNNITKYIYSARGVIVMELCMYKLQDILEEKDVLRIDETQRIIRGILDGVEYLHNNNIIHRDIKIDNILLSQEGEVKICDFGFAKILFKGEKCSRVMGTPYYFAPEILLKSGYDHSVDIWAIGVILYKCLVGRMPFPAGSRKILYHLIKKYDYTIPECIDDISRDLITKILCPRRERLSIQQIKDHEFFKLHS